MRIAFTTAAAIFAATAAHAESGIASIYGNGDGFAGRKTANGERMDPGALTAAHKTLRLGSRATVINRSTGKSVNVRISDRGPYVRGRVIDLTPAAAAVIGCAGLCNVDVIPQ